MNTSTKYYDIIVAVFVAVLLITQTVAQKIVALGPFNFSAGVLLFPISYIFGDVLTEVYGFSRSRRVIWIGFGCSAMMALVYGLSVWLPPAEGWNNQSSFQLTLGLVPRMVFASLLAYWAGEFSNSYVLAKLKVRMQGKHLWVRTIGSTIVGEALDTAVVMIVAFAGVLPGSLIWSVGWSIYAFKVAYEIAATPLTYWIVGVLKRAEGIDVYDMNTRFNPFTRDSR